MMRATVYLEHVDGRITATYLTLPTATPEEFESAVLYKSGQPFPAPLPMTDGAIVSFGPIGEPWRYRPDSPA